MNNKTILVLFIVLFIGISFTEVAPNRCDLCRDTPKQDKAYVYKCNTDSECQEEEEACLASGECVRNR